MGVHNFNLSTQEVDGSLILRPGYIVKPWAGGRKGERAGRRETETQNQWAKKYIKLYQIRQQPMLHKTL